MSSYGRQTQSKAQNDANARTLRALVKQPDNKVCVDCKRNDPRWASWNIGCFLCIRCSGIHRSMGTHISKVKSIDLDIWTPEQMASVEKWGNKRCNLYWEAHLKAGHVPPEHKVESFIRSKYETKRWAKDGPPPSDPSVLDGGSATPSAAAAASSSSTAASLSSTTTTKSARPAAPSAIDLLGGDVGPGPATTSLTGSRNSSLLDDPPATSNFSKSATTSPPQSSIKSPATANQPAKNASGGGGGGLFDLDWHAAPTSPSGSAAPTSKGSKNDILSLFSATSPKPAAPPSSSGLDAFGSLSLGSQQQQSLQQPGNFNSNLNSSSNASNPWGFSDQQTAAPAAANKNTGMFSTQDVWGSAPAVPSAAPSSNNNDIWGEMTSGGSTAAATGNSSTKSTQQQNDAFADIWK